MRHLSPAARAAPLRGLLAIATLHGLAVASFDAKTAPTPTPAATDLDTGQPLAIDLTAKLGGGKQHMRRDSAGPPIGWAQHKRRHDNGKAQNGGYHRQRTVALN